MTWLITRPFVLFSCFHIHNSSWHSNTRNDTRRGASSWRELCCITCQDNWDRYIRIQQHLKLVMLSSGDLPCAVFCPILLFVFFVLSFALFDFSLCFLLSLLLFLHVLCSHIDTLTIHPQPCLNAILLSLLFCFILSSPWLSSFFLSDPVCTLAIRKNSAPKKHNNYH